MHLFTVHFLPEQSHTHNNHIIDKLLYHGLKGLTTEAREVKQAEIMARHNFDHVSSYLKVKGFPFVRDPDSIKAVYARVKMCREYIKDVLEPKLGSHIDSRPNQWPAKTVSRIKDARLIVWKRR